MKMARYQYVPITLVIVGIAASVAFLTLGIRGAMRDQDLKFEKQASGWFKAIGSTWKDFELAGLWIHEACRTTGDHSRGTLYSICSREDFTELYEYVHGAGLNLQMMAFLPNVTDEYREELEEEAKLYYQENYPQVGARYQGFMGAEPDPDSPNGVSFAPRSKQPFYFPHHLIEPVVGNEHLIDFDTYSIQSRRYLIDALTSWKPVISDPIASRESIPGGTSIFLLHPGFPISTHPEQNQSSGLSSSTIEFSSFIRRATLLTQQYKEPVSIYIFDVSRDEDDNIYGGALINGGGNNDTAIEYLEATSISALRSKGKRATGTLYRENELFIAQQTWKVIVIASSVNYDLDLKFAILGTILILLAILTLALFIRIRIQRDAKISELKDKAEKEKAALIIDNAERAAKSERELNEYLSHEIRNPLTSAITACSFLSSSFHDYRGAIDNVTDIESYQVMKEDVNVVRSSLEFINDLLRSMLDTRKAVDSQLKLEMSHTSLLKDVLEPVRTILTQRGNNFDVEIDCPDDLVIMADRMRLKQIVLNIAGNSRKFVTQGFIRLRAKVIDVDDNIDEEDSADDDLSIIDKSSGSTSRNSTVISRTKRIEISVEDSGPGIPEEKRSVLFSRFQESLDTLNQGTGVGLFLCVSLLKLMDGTISLDEDFDSGIDGCPGSRFVISLNAEPIDLDEINLDDTEHDLLDQLERGVGHEGNSDNLTNNDFEEPQQQSRGQFTHGKNKIIRQRELPNYLSVLVVDDDMVLRKLLSRSLKRVAPEWNVQEAANGETALTLVDSENFDLIFMDQYMASVEKQMLGTETVFALRAKGVKCRICGLSANDMKDAFLDAGANGFMLKPFSNKKEDLKQDLLQILDVDETEASS